MVRGTSAQCPGPDHANRDRRTSLSIGQGRDGAVLNCHLGCLTDTVLEILGMSSADLFDEPRGDGTRRPQVVAEYRYTGEHGDLLFIKERYVPKTSSSSAQTAGAAGSGTSAIPAASCTTCPPCSPRWRPGSRST